LLLALTAQATSAQAAAPPTGFAGPPSWEGGLHSNGTMLQLSLLGA
jgi:hypothetical protein